MKNVKKFEDFQGAPDLEVMPPEVEERDAPRRPDDESGILSGRHLVDEVEGAEEEDDTYIGVSMMKELASELGEEVRDNSIMYNGQKINYYSETEKFHIGKKKFRTVEKVLNFLNQNEVPAHRHEEISEVPVDELGPVDESFLATKFSDFK